LYCVTVLLGLRKKTVAPGAGGLDEHLKNPGSTDLFGSSDAIVKHVLEVCACVYCCICCVYTSSWAQYSTAWHSKLNFVSVN